MAAETQEGEDGGLSRLQTSFVLGYHGCDRSVGEKALEGKIKLTKSNEDYNWLGPGIYFWEDDPKRALEWAKGNISRGKYKYLFVLGVVTAFGNCLDQMSRDNLTSSKRGFCFLKSRIQEGREQGFVQNTGRKPNKPFDIRTVLS